MNELRNIDIFSDSPGVGVGGGGVSIESGSTCSGIYIFVKYIKYSKQ
jgi:hypothetical protein